MTRIFFAALLLALAACARTAPVDYKMLSAQQRACNAGDQAACDAVRAAEDRDNVRRGESRINRSTQSLWRSQR